jgi:hypothetical protein
VVEVDVVEVDVLVVLGIEVDMLVEVEVPVDGAIEVSVELEVEAEVSVEVVEVEVLPQAAKPTASTAAAKIVVSFIPFSPWDFPKNRGTIRGRFLSGDLSQTYIVESF